MAAEHRRIWTEVVRSVPEGSGALVVAHGGAIEPALVSCLPDADHASWGGPFGHLDGVRLDFEDGRFTRARLRRTRHRHRPEHLHRRHICSIIGAPADK